MKNNIEKYNFLMDVPYASYTSTMLDFSSCLSCIILLFCVYMVIYGLWKAINQTYTSTPYQIALRLTCSIDGVLYNKNVYRDFLFMYRILDWKSFVRKLLFFWYIFFPSLQPEGRNSYLIAISVVVTSYSYNEIFHKTAIQWLQKKDNFPLYSL